jgi:methionyl-tRNA synthetase
VLGTAVRGLGILAVLLHPIIPLASEKLWAAVGGEGELGEVRPDAALEWRSTGRVGELQALFPRIDQAD